MSVKTKAQIHKGTRDACMMGSVLRQNCAYFWAPLHKTDMDLLD